MSERREARWVRYYQARVNYYTKALKSFRHSLQYSVKNNLPTSDLERDIGIYERELKFHEEQLSWHEEQLEQESRDNS
jgi:hypothetical protein